jgi:catechol 2,3-dioxygenase-like lactoylglutathione lyase family enzyme
MADTLVARLCRRSFLERLGAAAAALPLWAYSAHAQAPGAGAPRGQAPGGRGGNAAPAGPQLPLRTTGLEHFGLTVPDVEKAGRFYGAIFNPELHKENSEPLRYYVSMGIGYIALGINRQPNTPSRIDHFCALVDGYNAQAFQQELAAQGITVTSGGVGMVGDADGIQLQLLALPGGLARTTVPAGRIVDKPSLVRPMGLDHIMLNVTDVEKSAKYYRLVFGKEWSRSANPDRMWFQVGGTRLGIQAVKPGEAPKVDHFCVSVAGFDAAVVSAGLKELGAEILAAADESQDRTRFRDSDLIRFKDPNGVIVELRGRLA